MQPNKTQFNSTLAVPVLSLEESGTNSWCFEMPTLQSMVCFFLDFYKPPSKSACDYSTAVFKLLFQTSSSLCALCVFVCCWALLLDTGCVQSRHIPLCISGSTNTIFKQYMQSQLSPTWGSTEPDFLPMLPNLLEHKDNPAQCTASAHNEHRGVCKALQALCKITSPLFFNVHVI